MSDKARRYDYSPAEFLEGVSNLTVDEIGLYWVACSMMYARREAIANDAKWICRAAGCSSRKARSLIESLLAKGKLRLDDQGRLTNGRVLETIWDAQNRMKVARTGGESSSNARRTRRENEAQSRRINGLVSTSQQPATSSHQPSSSERVKSALRATPSASGAVSHETRARLIPDDWQPSDETVAKLRRSRPDLVGSFYDLELLKFRSWAAANAVLTHRIEASFIGFMIKARLAPRQTEEERVAERAAILARIRPKKEAPS